MQPTNNHKPNIYIFDDSKIQDQNHTLKVLHDRGVTGDLAEKYLAVRETKHCTLMTEADAEEIIAETNKVRVSFADALKYCLDRPKPWVGFKADWYQQAEGIAAPTSPYGNKTPEQLLAEQVIKRSAEAVPTRSGPPPIRLMDTLKKAQAERACA